MIIMLNYKRAKFDYLNMEKNEIDSDMLEGKVEKQDENEDDHIESSQINKKKESAWQDDQVLEEEGKLLNTRLIALFVIGILIGITLKTHAVKSITMGFEDYKLSKYSNDFGLDEAILDEEQDSQNSEKDTDLQSNGNSVESQEIEN